MPLSTAKCNDSVQMVGLTLPYRIMEELPVTRPEIQTSYSRCECCRS
jgi:hypothetical protein